MQVLWGLLALTFEMVDGLVVDAVVEDFVADPGLLVGEDAGVHQHFVRDVIVANGASGDLLLDHNVFSDVTW